MSEHIHQLAAAYALDALSDEERAHFDRHLPDCEACQQEIAGYQDTAAMLATAAAEPAPEGMRARVLGEVDRTRQDPVPLDAARSRRRLRDRVDWRHPGLAAAVAAVVVVAVIGVGGVVGQRLGDGPGDGFQPAWVDDAQTVALSGAEGASARFAYSPERNEGLLFVEGLEPVDPQRNVYQLWLFHDGEPVPAGIFTPDEEGRVRVPANAPVAGAELVAVTVEPPGGSSQPTSKPILAGELDTSG